MAAPECRAVKRIRIAGGWSLLVLSAGCGPGAVMEAPPPPVPTVIRRPATVEPSAPVSIPVKISAESDRDRNLAEFLRDHSGGLISEVAVGIERSGLMQVVLTGQTAPEDTLPLTKSLMAGARKDFPDRPFTLTVFDPSKAPILKARFDPEQGVRYELADEAGARAEAPKSPASRPVADSGPTDKDRRFEEWATEKGQKYLRYVTADLDRHGRLWFGVTREVKPADVPELTKSLLEGARTEFPRRELTATIFDPEGEKIGKATLGADGEVQWTQ